MSVEALYKINFGFSSNTQDGGVVILESQRVLGGDSGFYYVGDYSIDGNKMAANVRIRKHNASVPSIFGPAIRDIELTFNLIIDGAGCISGVSSYHDQQIHLTLTKVAPLP